MKWNDQNAIKNRKKQNKTKQRGKRENKQNQEGKAMLKSHPKMKKGAEKSSALGYSHFNFVIKSFVQSFWY